MYNKDMFLRKSPSLNPAWRINLTQMFVDFKASKLLSLVCGQMLKTCPCLTEISVCVVCEATPGPQHSL